MRARQALLPLAALSAGCWGGSLDRKDGSLKIHLLDLPPHTVIVDATLRGQRSFHARALPLGGEILDVFTSVPEGRYALDLRALGASSAGGGEVVLAERTGFAVDIVAQATSEPMISLSSAPDIMFDEPSQAVYRIADAAEIPLHIFAIDQSISTALTVSANGHDVEVKGEGDWTGTIDAHWAGDPLPASITVEATSCRSGSTICLKRTKTVEVTRTDAQASLEGAVLPPIAVGESDALFVVDRSGHLSVLSATSAATVHRAPLPAMLTTGPVLAGDLVAVADPQGGLHTFSMSALDPGRALDLGRPHTTAPIFAQGRILLGAGNQVVAVDPADLSAPPQTWIRLRGDVSGQLLAEGDRIAAADVYGDVIAVHAGGAPIFQAAAPGPVYAPLASFFGAVVAVTGDGLVVRFDPSQAGALMGSPLDLSLPVRLRPVVAGEDLVVAGGDQLAFIDRSGGLVSKYPVGAAITAGPMVVDARTVAVGLTSGVVLFARANAAPVPLSRIDGAVLSLALLSNGRVVAGGSRGDLQILRPEASFFP